jgi:hypothetical protein
MTLTIAHITPLVALLAGILILIVLRLAMALLRKNVVELR